MKGKFEAIMPRKWIDKEYVVNIKYEGEGPYNGQVFGERSRLGKKLMKRSRIEEIDWFLREIAIFATASLEDISNAENINNPKELFDKAMSLYELTKERYERYRSKIKEIKHQYRKEKGGLINNLLNLLDFN